MGVDLDQIGQLLAGVSHAQHVREHGVAPDVVGDHDSSGLQRGELVAGDRLTVEPNDNGDTVPGVASRRGRGLLGTVPGTGGHECHHHDHRGKPDAVPVTSSFPLSHSMLLLGCLCLSSRWPLPPEFQSLTSGLH